MDVVQYLPYVWLGLAVVFAIIEAATVGLTTIWFSIGAIVGMVCAILDFSPWVQFVVFLIISILLLWYTRPIAVRYLKIGVEKTNADSLIGKEGIVIKPIEKFKTGQVKVSGQIWTAVSKNNISIEKDTIVDIMDIEGVKLIVSNKN